MAENSCRHASKQLGGPNLPHAASGIRVAQDDKGHRVLLQGQSAQHPLEEEEPMAEKSVEGLQLVSHVLRWDGTREHSECLHERFFTVGLGHRRGAAGNRLG